MKQRLFLVTALILLTLGLRPALAQPANNNFANAFVVSGTSVSTNGNSAEPSNATRETGEPWIMGNSLQAGGRSVWFAWTAPVSALTQINTTNSSFNTLLGVYTGTSVSALSLVASNDNVTGQNSSSAVQFQAVQGTTYRIVVDGRSNFGTNPRSGAYNLNIRVLASVAISSPGNNSVFVTGAPIPITVASSVPNPLTRVDLYRAGTLVDTDTAEPFTFAFTPAAPGTNGFFVVGTDTTSLLWTSAVVNIIARDPGVILTAPADGAAFWNTNPISVSASALAASGGITSVAFLVNSETFASDTTSPYNASWAGVVPGMHRLTAIAADNQGRAYTSAPVLIAVAVPLVSTGSVWKYLDDGSDQGIAWRSPEFPDGSWAAGPAQLGYGDGDEATLVSFGPDEANKHITTYFRHAFYVTNAATYSNLLFSVLRDDGAVLYLNGVEVARQNMPAGDITYTTPASGATDNENSYYTNTTPATLLREGLNVLAVEVHQNVGTSSDLSFDLRLQGIPIITRNQFPFVQITSPTNNAAYLAPGSIPIATVTSDADGEVTKVEYFVDGVRLGERTTPPFNAVWIGPTIGWHTLHVVATDNEGASQASAPVAVSIYDADGTPLVQWTGPATGSVFDAPANLTLSANATAAFGLTNVLFLNNGALLGADSAPPFAFQWLNVPPGTQTVAAVAMDSRGLSATSSVVTLTIRPAPTNEAPPTIAAVTPAPGSMLVNLTSIEVRFSENVTGVNAADLLVNGVAATGLTGSGSNYTFTVAQPAYGTVSITWAANHGIRDLGPGPTLPFDATGPGASWTYSLNDGVPPTITGRNPAPGSTLANVTIVAATFSEPVTGVNAADLLVNNIPAIGLSGGPSSYTFAFPSPGPGSVVISWAPNHGITDSSGTPFDATAPNASWSYTVTGQRVTLVASNAPYRWLPGTNEASAPLDAWRAITFPDTAWPTGQAPFYYDDDGSPVPFTGNTLLSGMRSNYTCIFARQAFVMTNRSLFTKLILRHRFDDGAIVWLNGTEIARVRLPAGDIPFTGTADTVTEPIVTNSIALPDPSPLVNGVNVLAVQAFNASTGSSDFLAELDLIAEYLNPATAAPRIASVAPLAGEVFALTDVTVIFNRPVTNVDAADLRANGSPATGVAGSNTVFTFTFPQPPYGIVAISWATNHGITDQTTSALPFDATAPTANWQYTLRNPNAPLVAGQTPPAGATITELGQITIAFTKNVTGVDASDLRVNGLPASGVIGSGASYTFTFTQPAYGLVSIGWAASHGIRDLETPANDFDATRVGSIWSYTLVDLIPPAVIAQAPPAGALVTNLTAVTVTFSEPVSGVDARDLLVNGVPATGVSGSGALYTFHFPTPNATSIQITWAANHGIADLATVPNAFVPSAFDTWFYLTPDTVPPSVASISPPPEATLRTLRSVIITFTEPVVGVSPGALRVNGAPAQGVTGADAGPYTFSFPQPVNGPVEITWSADHTITDIALEPNRFLGGEWTYILDPNASFADKVVINEIMLSPFSGREADEWIELHNASSETISLSGWRFSRGISFTFPNVALPAGGYLAVAADLAAFQAKYPDVTNAVGGWTGRLSNNDETVELVTVLDEVVDSVHYAIEGDWARRERGHGANLVAGITREGSTARVSLFGHNFTGSDIVMISGADQPEYNGFFGISGITSAGFNISVPGAPATPATGRIICRHVRDNGASGWSWFSEADGYGSSLELVNPTLPNQHGQSWLSSTQSEGTPGRANSVLRSDVPPLVLDVTHFPPVPKSTDSVALTARVRDELPAGVQSVTLFYRNHSTTSPLAFSTAPMLDDGASGDGTAGDGLYGAVLPPAANGTIMEFYVRATDTSGLSRTWPAPTWETNNTFAQLANAQYQVDDANTTSDMPFLRVIMTETERAQLAGIDTGSDAEMNTTFISVDGDGVKVRYLCGMRLRGAGSRGGQPKNYRVNLPADNRWNDVAEINLNSRYVHAQLAGSVLAQKAGLACADARVVQLRVNGQNLATAGSVNFGCYLLIEPIGADWAANQFPLDPDGNVYRASKFPWNANLDYLGTNAATYQGNTGAGYYKTSNRRENDWTDLFRLTYALSTNTAAADYVAAVQANANVEECLRYFAVCNFFDYMETSLTRGVGDDYAMYRGGVDRRFRFIAHDFDTILGQGDTAGSTTRSIWVMIDSPASNDPAQRANFLRRFMRHPEFAPIYFRLYKQLLDTTFAPENLDPVLDQMLGGWVTGNTIPAMKTFAANRRTYVLGQIPLALTATTSLNTQSGYLRTANPNVTLTGQADVIETRRVLVNGTPSIWSAWEGRWTNTVALQPGINQVLVQSVDANNVEFSRTNLVIWYDRGAVQNVSGTIATDTVWPAANGPYNVTANLTVANGATLTLQPGTTVYLGSGVNFTVANGGRLLAEGTETAPIRFTRAPGASTTWGGITVNGSASSPETRIVYAHIEFNNSTAIQSTDGTVFLANLTFGNTGRQYVSLDRSSFVVQDCTFPATTGAFEPTHGSGGIKAGGRGLFLRNFFGAISGYNDTLDFTGGNRPGPILQIIDNVFMGTGDDHLDLDSTDAWVEGNIFLHTHKNGSPDTASGVSGGADNADTSQITILRNIFYNCDQAAMAKQGNFFTLYNNTVVRQTRQGGTDTDSGVICLADEGTVPGAGMYLEGNVIYDAEKLVRNPSNAAITITNNLMPFSWSGPGGGNSSADPLFNYIPAVTETSNFTSWAQAQVMWDWFSLRPGSPARGTGPNGADLGAADALRTSDFGLRTWQRGVSIAGEPWSPTPRTTVTLTVGLNRAGSGIPTAGWPNGSGYTHYRWRLDGGEWSAESPLAAPIQLSGLGNGVHSVEVVGRNDAGLAQDDPLLGPDARTTVSRTWTVVPGTSVLRLSEVLASNVRAVPVGGKYPDLIELFNESTQPVELSGMRLTDDPREPDKFIFPYEATIPGGGYLVLYANEPDGTPGYHLGFNLSASGEGVYLFDAAENGGALLDSVVFGPQVSDFSIGRLADGAWALTVPTFGGPNQAAPIGDPSRLRINEWLAIAEAPFAEDFLELYNPTPLPVALGGLYLSDEILGWTDRHQIAALSFIPAYGFARFLADGNPDQGAEHLGFQLSGDQGAIGLYLPDLTVIDLVLYQAQRANISQGRTPNGGSMIAFLAVPTPGAGNPLVSSAPPPLAIPLVGMTNGWRYNQSGADLGTAWREPGYNDTDWPSGAALLAVEDCGCLPYAINTPLSLTSGGANVVTYYFRREFVAPTNGAISALAISHVLDDGAVFYLNGQEVLRVNLPAGTVTAATLTSSSVGDATLVGPVEVPADALVPGTNVLAVEVHQSSVGSSDVVFGLALDALVVTNTAASGAVVINEVLALNNSLAEADGSTPDWVEFMNLSAGRVALGGLGLTDDSLKPQRWVFPAEAEIAPGGYLRILCDGGRPASATNTGFGLKATGGSVYLFDSPTNGGSLLSSVTYGIQLGDFTIGREPDGSTNWVLTAPTPKAPNAAVSSLGNASNLRVNEWMADPGPGENDWFEIYNPEPQPVALGGLHLTDNLNNRIKHRIAPLSFIGAGPNAWLKFIADNNTAAGADHVNFALSAAGEAIGLATASGAPIDAYAFGAQAEGVSQGRFPDGASEVVTFPGTASPGESNYRRLTDIVINEVLTRTSEPLEDAIEVRNLTAQDIDLSGWWLSDDQGTLQKYRIPFGTILPANGFAVFYANSFTNPESATIPFALSSAGDEVVLSAAANGQLTGWRTRVKFAAADAGVSFGRYVTSDLREEFVALTERTFGVDDPGSVEQFRTGTGAPNADPRVGPVVFTEIMYHPPDLGTNDNTRDEFVELQNITTAPVALFVGTNGWRLRAGVDFDFAPGTSIAPGDYLLVVSFDPVNNPVALAAFRAQYNVDPSVPIVGPYSGKLDNGGEAIELRKPGPVTEAGLSWVLVERISYLDRYPWDADADGTGWSLQRVLPGSFGNDPANWLAAAPTPGPQALPLDRDRDGMLDAWETANGLDPDDPSDAGLDPDGDGLTNLEEFLAGTDPNDSASVLRIETVAPVVDGTNLVFEFLAQPNLSYTVEYADTLGSAWNRLLDIEAAQTNRVIEVITPASGPGRFFRLRTPMRPAP